MYPRKLAVLTLVLTICHPVVNSQTAATGKLSTSTLKLSLRDILPTAEVFSSSRPGAELAFINPGLTDSAFADPDASGSILPTLRRHPKAAPVTPPEPDEQPKVKSKPSKNHDKLKVHPFSTVALAVKGGSLGAGAELATPLTRTLNLRGGVNFVGFRYSFSIDGINYYTAADFRSAQLSIDWFPFHGGFHISPGALYFRNGLDGAAKVDPGKSFTLNKTTYINSVDDPVSGTASVQYAEHIAPTLTFGFTNIIPRTGGHFSMPFEFGAAYTKAPVMAVQLAGTACTNQGCFNAGSDIDTQKNLQQEVVSINETVQLVKVYPIVSLGIALRF